MSMPSDLDGWKTLVGGIGAALLAAWGWIFTATHRKIDSKASKESFDKLEATVRNHTITSVEFGAHVKADERLFNQIVEEAKIQRGHISKIFDKIADTENKNRDRHDATMEAIHRATEK